MAFRYRFEIHQPHDLSDIDQMPLNFDLAIVRSLATGDNTLADLLGGSVAVKLGLKLVPETSNHTFHNIFRFSHNEPHIHLRETYPDVEQTNSLQSRVPTPKGYDLVVTVARALLHPDAEKKVPLLHVAGSQLALDTLHKHAPKLTDFAQAMEQSVAKRLSESLLTDALIVVSITHDPALLNDSYLTTK